MDWPNASAAAGLSTGAAERRLGLWLEAIGHLSSREHVLPRRTREDFLIMYVVGGNGILRNGNRLVAVPTGAVVGCFPHVPHEYRSDPVNGWRIWWIHFGGPLAAQLVSLCDLRPASPLVMTGVDSELIGHFGGLLACVRSAAPHAGLDASARLYRLLIEIARRSYTSGIGQDALLDAAQGEPEDLAAMAQVAGMSRFAYSRAFKGAFGISPWRYVIMRRVARAKQMLTTTSMPVKEIAATCGFRDVNYFYRAFRREAGTSPGAYRSTRP